MENQKKSEKKINYGLIIFIIVLIILFIPIISDYVKKQNIEVLSVKEFTKKIEDKESFVVYAGELENGIKKDLRDIRDIDITDYGYDYSVYSVKDSKSLESIGDDVKVAVIVDGDVQKTYTKYDEESLNKDVQIYFLGNIDDENKAYKVAEDFNAYKKLVKSDKTIMTVFGRNTCFYCNKFKPVYNALAEKYNVDIYYFDSDSYDVNEYNKIINMDLTVPAKCSSEGKEFKLSDPFGTPLTIFTQKGKIVDCISGYVNRDSLIEKLKTNKMISE